MKFKTVAIVGQCFLKNTNWIKVKIIKQNKKQTSRACLCIEDMNGAWLEEDGVGVDVLLD